MVTQVKMNYIDFARSVCAVILCVGWGGIPVEAALKIPWSDSTLCLWYCLAFHVEYMPSNSCMVLSPTLPPFYPAYFVDH